MGLEDMVCSPGDSRTMDFRTKVLGSAPAQPSLRYFSGDDPT
jgi:hypothetical protein